MPIRYDDFASFALINRTVIERVSKTEQFPSYTSFCQLTSSENCQFLSVTVTCPGCTLYVHLTCPYTGGSAASSAIVNPSDLYALYLSFCLIMLNVFLFLEHFYYIFFVSF
jgi:hypothetical protein